jgi:hypothetical protein
VLSGILNNKIKRKMRDYLDIKFNSEAFLIEICVFFAPALVNKATELLTD